MLKAAILEPNRLFLDWYLNDIFSFWSGDRSFFIRLNFGQAWCLLEHLRLHLSPAEAGNNVELFMKLFGKLFMEAIKRTLKYSKLKIVSRL